jgi:hypothetical protein
MRLLVIVLIHLRRKSFINNKYLIMKNIGAVCLLLLTLAFSNNIKAQAWDKDSKVLTLGLGGAYHYYIEPGLSRYSYGYYGARSINANHWNLNGMLQFQGEFGVHKYVGVGFCTGFGGSAASGGLSVQSVEFPIGAQCNFHFYQLIADKVSKDIHADKLDIYAGGNIGTGVGYDFSFDNIVVPIWGGVQIGARYWFTDKFGVYAEVCPYTGKTFIQGGVSFKL